MNEVLKEKTENRYIEPNNIIDKESRPKSRSGLFILGPRFINIYLEFSLHELDL